MSYSKVEAAFKILKEKRRPMTAKEIVDIAIRRGLIKTKGKTPDSTLRVDILLENRRRHKQNRERRFIAEGKSTFSLTKWQK